MKFLKRYFSRRLTKDELLSLLVAMSFFGDDGERLMEDGRTAFSLASRDPSLREWMERRKSNLLKYATVDGMVGDVRRLLGEYDMLISMMSSSSKLPSGTVPAQGAELQDEESIREAWQLKKSKQAV